MLSVIRTDSGKVIYNGTYNPCDKLEAKSMLRLMKMILRLTKKGNLEDYVPITWFCPIKKVFPIKL